MMKRILYSLWMLSILAACHEAGETVTAPGADTHPVCLDIRLGGISLQGRSGLSNLDHKNIGIYAINATDGETSYGNAPAGTSATYLVTGGSSIAAVTGKALWLNNQSATIYAAYPIGDPNNITPGSGATDAPLLPVSSNAFSLANTLGGAPVSGNPSYYDCTRPEYDYLYGVKYENNAYQSTQPTAHNGSPSVTLGMKHALAQLYIKVKKDATYPGPCLLSSLSCTFGNLPALKAGNASRMSLKDGSFTGTDAAASRSYTYAVSTSDVSAGTNGLEFRNYALPATGVTLSAATLTIDGKVMSLSPATGSSTDWAAGNIYRYTFTVKGTGLVLSGFEVVDWKTGQNLDNVTIK